MDFPWRRRIISLVACWLCGFCMLSWDSMEREHSDTEDLLGMEKSLKSTDDVGSMGLWRLLRVSRDGLVRLPGTAST